MNMGGAARGMIAQVLIRKEYLTLVNPVASIMNTSLGQTLCHKLGGGKVMTEKLLYQDLIDIAENWWDENATQWMACKECSFYHHDPGFISGPPEKCYPPETDCNVPEWTHCPEVQRQVDEICTAIYNPKPKLAGGAK